MVSGNIVKENSILNGGMLRGLMDWGGKIDEELLFTSNHLLKPFQALDLSPGRFCDYLPFPNFTHMSSYPLRKIFLTFN